MKAVCCINVNINAQGRSTDGLHRHGYIGARGPDGIKELHGKDVKLLHPQPHSKVFSDDYKGLKNKLESNQYKSQKLYVAEYLLPPIDKTDVFSNQL